MSIVPTSDSLALAGQRDSQKFQDRVRGVELTARTREWQSQNKEQLDQLREKSQQLGMEVRLHVMPQSSRIVIRFVEPTSGKLIREFPSEGLTQALADLQEKLTFPDDKLALVDQRV